MLEPRRIAARQIAERMSAMIDEKPGETVGYRVRFESKVSSETRLEVLTEGILTRMMTEDPTLDGVSTIIFDEFHERSLNSDTALALAREIRSILREDLRIIIMSATIDAAPMAEALGARIISCEGRCYPVQTIYSDAIEAVDAGSVALAVTNCIRKAYRDQEGDILAFLPGEAEIRRCAEALQTGLGDEVRICPLYGQLPFEQQHAAIAPSRPGERKIVLATPIAETSLTIEGVRVVVDSGLHRKMNYDAQSCLSRMSTERISLDMARQRCGRAGRVAPGVCYRLWNKGLEYQLKENRKPEIEDADLTSAILEVAAWGEADMEKLQWLTPPQHSHVQTAMQLCTRLGALDGKGLTPLGRKMVALPCHPRIARMLLAASEPAEKSLACDLAALLEERDRMSEAGADITLRINELRHQRSSRPARGWERVERIASQYRSMVKAAVDNSSADPFAAGALIAAAYPERIAKADADGCGQLTLATGQRALLDRSDELSAYDWVAVASMGAREGAAGKVFLAAPLSTSDLSDFVRERDNVSWDAKTGKVIARHERNIGSLLLDSRPLDKVSREQVVDVICKAAQKYGESMLDFSDKVHELQIRVATVASWHPELELPDLSTAAVLANASDWLPLYIGNPSELRKIDLAAALWGMLDYSQQLEVERLAPSHITVPTGSRIRVEYRVGAEVPVLRVRLQECFGMLDTPRVDDGRRPVLMELLSPGFKPVQLTSDLASFWSGTYFEVRSELRRRYPKHSWPDNPLQAEAVRGVKK